MHGPAHAMPSDRRGVPGDSAALANAYTLRSGRTVRSQVRSKPCFRFAQTGLPCGADLAALA